MLVEYVTFPAPRTRGSGESVMVNCRSMVALTVVLSAWVLFEGVGSPWSALITEVRVLVPPAPGVTTTVTV